MIKPTLAVLAASLALSGCQSALMSDARAQRSIAFAVNDPNAVILDRSDDGLTNTFVSVRAKGGVYNCRINGGGVLAMGIINPPDCVRR